MTERDLEPSGNRIPPQNLDAERSVLGAILLEQTALDDVAELLEPRDFYRDANRKVYEAMRALAARTEPVDRVTVKAELARAGVFASVGGDDFVDLLDKVVPVSTNAVWYARIVAEKALARRVLEAAQATVLEAYESAGTGRELAERAEQRMFETASAQQIGPGWVHVGDLLGELQRTITARYERGGEVTGLPTGLRELDDMTSGFQAGELVVVGARPSMGKSSLMLTFARAIARAPAPIGGTVGVFSIEMPSVQQLERLIAIEGRINLLAIRKGQLTDAEWARYVEAARVVDQHPLVFDHTPQISVSQIRARTRRLAAQSAAAGKPLRAICIDFLQLINHGQQPHEREDQAITRTVVALKAIALQLGLVVILLSQLNRGVEQRPDRRPRMSDLRECGALEQAADVILFPYRDHVYDKRTPETEAEIGIAKQRQGPTGVARAAWLKDFAAFGDLDQVPVKAEQRSLGLEPPPHTDEDAR